MLFALSLIDAPQAAEAMVKIAKHGKNEISSLAKSFIDKRDQGIWNKFKVKDILAGKSTGENVYADRLAQLLLALKLNYPVLLKFFHSNRM